VIHLAVVLLVTSSIDNKGFLFYLLKKKSKRSLDGFN